MHDACVCMMCGCACRWYELVLAAEDDIATIMTMEGGKPLKESKGEFASGYVSPHPTARCMVCYAKIA